MGARKHTRKREDIKKVRDAIGEEHEKIQKALPPIVKDTGGSIGNLKIDTPEFKKWVVELRENVNPFIGKDYLKAAPEFKVEDDIKKPEVEELSNKLDETLDKGAAEYDPEGEDCSPEVEEVEDIRGNDRQDEKFIDISIIENATRDLTDETIEEISKIAVEKIKEYHDDEKYEVELPVKKIIKKYKNLLIAEAAKTKMLKYDPEKEKIKNSKILKSSRDTKNN